MTEKLINLSLKAVFSKPSLYVHTAWFVIWFVLHMNVGLLTNIVSLEAIYIGIFVGIQQISHHEIMKDRIEKK